MACCDHVNNVNSCNFVRYVNSRELGHSFSRLHQNASDAVTSHRHLKPLIADASPNCRSTYLLRLNQNNRLLAAAHGDKTVAIYCASTGRLLSRCVGHERSPWTLAFHPSQPYLLASGCLGGSIRLWNLESLATVDPAITHQVYNLKSTKFWTHAGAIASLAFHPVHPILIAAWTQEVVFYDWVSGRKLSVWRFVSNQSRVRWVKFNPDGVLLYTATANPSLSQTAIVGKPRNKGSHCTEGSETRGNDAMSSSPQSSMQFSSAISSHNLISRDLLLEFLVGQPDAWFTQLGVCETCSFRLCRWAGTLGPKFPASTFDAQQSMKLVSRVAEVIAKQMRLTGIPLSRLVQELLSHRDQSSDVPRRLLLDADPVAVAVIEDMPVREFLLSRGNYCSEPSALTKDGSLCCGGHACDLVLAHRELMRHSICRPCLAAFWRWASRYVDWWCFANSSFASLSSDCPNIDRKIPDDDSIPTITNHFVGQDSNSTDLRMDQSISLTNPTITAGICIQCRAGVSGNHKPALIDSLSKSMETSRSETPSKSRHLPLAALDLLRSRLSNANEVTPVTYMAPDLISKGPLTDYIRKSLRSDATDYPKTSNLSSTLRLMLCTTAAQVSSPLPKRRKTDSSSSLSDDQSACLSNANMDTSHNVESCSSGKLAYNGQQTELSCNMAITCCGTLRHRSLVQEAAELGRLIANRLDPGVWNRPRPVRLVSRGVCQPDLSPTLKLFPYVATGCQLLKPNFSSELYPIRPCKLQPGRSRAILQRPLVDMVGQGRDTEQAEYPDKSPEDRSMTACCRCGHIVPQTFPIDPQSSLSAVVCERLVLSDDHCGSAFNHDFRVGTSPPSSAGTPIKGDGCLATHPSPQSSSNLPSLVEPATQSPSNNATQKQKNVMYLINRTNGDSMLNAVHRSITEVIAGLFVDMGEHGSASCIQDTTYRICRWELNLCDPVRNRANCSSDHGDTTDLKTGGPIHPMPANVAVSYNTNSLVIPHARLFNDSSICLSPDGRMLAAFVVPNANNSGRSRSHCFASTGTTNDAITSMDTLLAVYRLQPKARRGQCLFARRFTTASPVCLDFSPLSDYLAVGMATTRLPSADLPASSLRHLSSGSVTSGASQRELLNFDDFVVSDVQSAADNMLIPKRYECVAQIFRLERILKKENTDYCGFIVQRTLSEVVTIKHPMFLNPISSSRQHLQHGRSDVDQLDRWHRLVLSASTGISLNTILWNPSGGLFYGTTKGLVVIMGAQPTHLSPQVTVELTESSTDTSEGQKPSICNSFVPFTHTLPLSDLVPSMPSVSQYS
ncbi:hypothetical protein P879_03796 [Paragonimus westermani]|uniref:Activating molecule in BECN1-regulated autophagy protein 1 n=1 Tax=Paragonimus westermani TaxID=34504 RepID=A0A8T0DSZ8_9TREM|nr:hypothetical protein P879_03796 [Paragonimus westermani]